MQIIDFSGITVSAIFAQNMVNDLSEDLLRHVTLNSLRMYNHKFGREYGQVYIACDHSSWRKKVFEYYKANRKTKRDESPLDWNQLFDWLNNITEEIRQYLPYHVLSVPGAEADDIIAVLVERTQEFGKGENVMIVSSDKDFKQLQKYPNVKQFSSIQKKFLVEKNPQKYLFEHIVRGDSSDGVPNIFSDDDTFVAEGKRQKPLSQKKIDAFYDEWSRTGEITSFAKQEHRRNFDRNRKMVDLSQIPSDIVEKINTQIEDVINKKQPTTQDLMNYLISKRCTKLLPKLNEFIVQ